MSEEIFFRDATPEERRAVDKYIRKISNPTGINFFNDDFEEIREYLSQEEILAALAEEAAELSQAALKMRRVLNHANFTPISFEEAEDNLIEEIGDVNNCVKALGYDYVGLNEKKIKRWVTRLEDDGK